MMAKQPILSHSTGVKPNGAGEETSANGTRRNAAGGSRKEPGGAARDCSDAHATVDPVKKTTTGASQTPRPADGFTAASLQRMKLPEPRWAVPGLIPVGLTILAARPKMGKSWMALGIAIAVATGEKALGSIPVEQGKVLYLALEDTRRRLKDRMASLMGEDEWPADLIFHLEWLTFGNGGDSKLDDWLTENPDTRLVVIDTLGRARKARYRNSNAFDEDYASIASIKAIADKHGVAVLVIHHTRKMAAVDPLDAVSGTNGLTGAADCILVLQRSRGQSDATLNVYGRDVEEREDALSFDSDVGAWTLLGSAEAYCISKERSVYLTTLADAFKATGCSQTPTQMQKRLPGNKKNGTVRKMLSTMARNGQIDSDGNGGYRPKSM